MSHLQKFGDDIQTLPHPITGQAIRLGHKNKKSIIIYITKKDLADLWISALKDGVGPYSTNDI